MIRWLCLLTLVTLAPAQLVRVDTIGWTTRDRQAYGPALRLIAYDSLSGIHACWKDGVGDIRYNYRPRRGAWRWAQGVLVNPEPRSLGCLDYDEIRGRAYISADYLYRTRPAASVFTDTGRGTGVFVEASLGTGYRPALVGAANFGYTKFAAVRNDTLYYRSALSGYRVGHIGSFPAFSLGVSKQSGRYGCIWTVTEGDSAGRLHLKQTPNNGANWYATVPLSDSVPSVLNKSLLSGSAAYDSIRIHLVAEFYDGGDVNNVEIWHYCPYNAPAWSLVHAWRLPEFARVGDAALAACRPSIGINHRTGERYAVWEQFDPDNLDPLTGLARADIWAARSTDRGLTWGPPARLTQPDNSSKRFPYLAENVADTLSVICFADSVAGFSEQGQGPPSTNPVLCLRVSAAALPVAVAEPSPPSLRHIAGATILPAAALDGRQLYDALGRRVNRPVSGVYFTRSAGGLRRVVVLFPNRR
ncbi:MAG: hypothetical protein R6X13_06925 [bacterium]